MSDVYTTSSSTDYVQEAYDRLAYPALRPELHFDKVATVKPIKQSMPGLTVAFNVQNDLPVASTALNESTDVASVAISSSQVSVTLAEYGSAVISTAKLRGGSMVDIDEVIANVVGFNGGVSIDSVARAVLEAGTNVNYSAGATGVTPSSRATVTTADTFSAYDVRVANKTLIVNNVPRVNGSYWAFIHPEVSFDLQADTGLDGWLVPRVYGAVPETDNLWNGELGTFSGVRFIETPRAPEFLNAGSSSASGVYNVFGTLFGGQQAFAKAYSTVDGNGEDPHIVPGPVTDSLRRFVPIGWYQLVGYGIFRQAALLRVESSSSIQALIAGVTVNE